MAIEIDELAGDEGMIMSHPPKILFGRIITFTLFLAIQFYSMGPGSAF